MLINAWHERRSTSRWVCRLSGVHYDEGDCGGKGGGEPLEGGVGIFFKFELENGRDYYASEAREEVSED